MYLINVLSTVSLATAAVAPLPLNMASSLPGETTLSTVPKATSIATPVTDLATPILTGFGSVIIAVSESSTVFITPSTIARSTPTFSRQPPIIHTIQTSIVSHPSSGPATTIYTSSLFPHIPLKPTRAPYTNHTTSEPTSFPPLPAATSATCAVFKPTILSILESLAFLLSSPRLNSADKLKIEATAQDILDIPSFAFYSDSLSCLHATKTKTKSGEVNWSPNHPFFASAAALIAATTPPMFEVLGSENWWFDCDKGIIGWRFVSTMIGVPHLHTDDNGTVPAGDMDTIAQGKWPVSGIMEIELGVDAKVKKVWCEFNGVAWGTDMGMKP